MRPDGLPHLHVERDGAGGVDLQLHHANRSALAAAGLRLVGRIEEVQQQFIEHGAAAGGSGQAVHGAALGHRLTGVLGVGDGIAQVVHEPVGDAGQRLAQCHAEVDPRRALAAIQPPSEFGQVVVDMEDIDVLRQDRDQERRGSGDLEFGDGGDAGADRIGRLHDGARASR